SARAPALAVFAAEPKAFAQAWQRLGMREQVLPTRAYSFRRKQGPAVLELTLTPPRVEARQEVAWRVHPRHADFEASAVLTAARAGLMLAEWDVPGHVTVAWVTGPRVRHWTRGDGRVQVWLTPAEGENDSARVEM